MSWFGEWDGFDEEMQNAPDIFARKPTNADRIRAMSDEELAVICEDGCPPHHECPPTERVKMTLKNVCQQCWLEWLKKEAEEVEEVVDD